MSALSSSASVGGRLWHATSIAVIYSLYEGLGSYSKVWSMCQECLLCARQEGVV